MLKETEVEPQSRWNWVFWWRADESDVDWQATHYSELMLTDSFKGWSAIMLVISSVLSCALAMVAKSPAAYYFDPAFFLVLAGFVYLGHRWAIITAMVYWTLAKIVQIVSNPLLIVIALLWWGLFMHAFYMAYLVEKRRRMSRINVEIFE